MRKVDSQAANAAMDTGVVGFLLLLVSQHQHEIAAALGGISPEVATYATAFLGVAVIALRQWIAWRTSESNPDGRPAGAPYRKEEKQSARRRRTDRHNNPTAFTVDIAKQAGLREGVEYLKGDPFAADGRTYHTARLIGDPVELTLLVLERIGFYTQDGVQRWSHTAYDRDEWEELTRPQKIGVVERMYRFEGGEELAGLFDVKIAQEV